MRIRGLILALCLALTLSSFADAAKIVQPASSGAPSGPASGDLGGTYPNPTVTSGAHVGAATLPLTAIVGPSPDFFLELYQSQANVTPAFPSNATNGTADVFPTPRTLSNICANIQTSDATGLYDWGFYNSAGTLIADVGPQHITTTNFYCKPAVQGTVKISGAVTFAVTGNAATAHYYASQFGNCAASTTTMTGGTTSGGQLNASGLTIPAYAPVATSCITYAFY